MRLVSEVLKLLPFMVQAGINPKPLYEAVVDRLAELKSEGNPEWEALNMITEQMRPDIYRGRL